MANYNVDIAVALKGADKLRAFDNSIKSLSKNIENANFFIRTFAKNNDGLVRSVGNLQQNLNSAGSNLRNVALGTKEATIAAAQFLKAQEGLNKGLVEQQKLLDDVSGATARKSAADNQELQNALLKLERQSTKEQEQQFSFRQQGQEQLKQKVQELNKQRTKENQLLKENVNKTKESVAEEIKKKFSIIASQSERRKNLKQSVKELEAARTRIPIEERINAQLKKRGLILSANGKKIVSINQNQKAAANKQAVKTVGSTASSAIIGGAFPLLFGQTGAAAVGGGIGGAAGGLIGGQFGFALSILGTAIGSFIQQQDELDKSLSKISRSFENAGSSAGFTRESFNELKSTLGMTRDEVLAVASAFSRFGEAGKSAAFIFGDNPNTFKNLAAMRDTKTLMTAILDEQNGLGIEQQIQLLREAKLTSFKDMQLKLNRMILEENLKREIIEARQITRQDKITDIFKDQLKFMLLIGLRFHNLEKIFPEFFKKSAEKSEEDVQKIQEEFDKLVGQLPKVQDLLTELDTQVQGMSFSIPSAMDSVSAELRKLMSLGFRVTTTADTIGNAFGESFKGIVKGSMTAQDALRNLFQKTADAFLDMAARIIAEQIKLKILRIGLDFFGSAFDKGFASSRGSRTGGTDIAGRDVDDEFFGMPKGFEDRFNDTGDLIVPGKDQRALGGPVNKGGSFIVGERGPELFVPNQSGNIIPNHDLAGIGGGGINIVVNVDASGSSVQSDGDGQQFGEALATAIQLEIVKQKRSGGLLA